MCGVSEKSASPLAAVYCRTSSRARSPQRPLGPATRYTHTYCHASFKVNARTLTRSTLPTQSHTYMSGPVPGCGGGCCCANL
eukprot:scaffold12264_cov58-Phaeocystis_antarctica.AAC.2